MLKNIEIICIDDGSTDNSGHMLDEYAQNDNRIKVIHKENGGYGKAMNVGLEHATGEYIGIVEPDDYIELNMYQEMYDIAKQENVDFVKCDYKRFYTEPTFKETYQYTLKTPELYNKVLPQNKYLAAYEDLACCIWSFIYKKDFLDKNNIKFLETPGASYQDTSFWIKVMLDAKNGYFIDKAYNHYRIDNPNSSVKSNSKIFFICDEFKELENKYKNSIEKIKIINALKLDKYAWNYGRLKKKGRNKFYKVFKPEISYILNNKLYDNCFNVQCSINACKTILRENSIIKRICSVSNSNNHKIIMIMGIKLKIKSNK